MSKLNAKYDCDNYTHKDGFDGCKKGLSPIVCSGTCKEYVSHWSKCQMDCTACTKCNTDNERKND